MPDYMVKAGGTPPPEIEDDIYEVELKSITAVDLEKPDVFGRTELLQWDFGLTETEDDSTGEPIILNPRTSRVFSPKSTAFKWAVVLGVEPEIGKRFNPDILVGKRARANVQTSFRDDGSPGWPRIKDLIALPRQQRQARPPSVAKVADARADIMATLKQIQGLVIAEDFKAICAEIVLQWPETGIAGGKCVPSRVTPEHAEALLAAVREHLAVLQPVDNGEEEDAEGLPFE